MHAHFSAHSSTLLAGELIAFTASLLITVLLLALTIRAAKLRGNPVANILFAVCALFWSASGLASIVLGASGVPAGNWVMSGARNFQYCGVLAFPIPILWMWEPLATDGRKRTMRMLRIAACLSAGVAGALLWTAALPMDVRRVTAYNAAAFLLLGAAIAVKRNNTSRSVFISSWTIVGAVCGAALIMSLHFHLSGGVDASLGAIGGHMVMLVVLCAFFLFARFRYADVFIRYGVRILLAAFWVALIVFLAQLWPTSSLRWAAIPQAIHVFGVMSGALVLLLCFTFVDERISGLIQRWLFRSPDYRALSRQLADRLRRLSTDEEVMAATEAAVKEALESSDVRVSAVNGSSNWPAGLLEGEIVEAEDAGTLVPIPTPGGVHHVLRATTSAGRPGLVMRDLNYLRTVAAQCGNRLEALTREREAIERESREAVLVQQVTEAELRALRAQINPHFLFNSLNTIADLIVRDPGRAEAMTLRLAAVFRHVLTQSTRQLITVREEMDFLRTYLHIEEARFGDRLQVEMEMDPDVAPAQIPSLLLQPLVENALKHGLAPKVGRGSLKITAQSEGDQLRLVVEDDGIGMAAQTIEREEGHGLANVTNRLSALYQDRASVLLEPREGGGTRAIVQIPRTE